MEGGRAEKYIDPEERVEESRKEEWNANRPAVADSGRPMSDEHEAFGGEW